MRAVTIAAVVAAVLVTLPPASAQTGGAPAADPVFVLETVRGIVEIRLFPADAPKSVEQILALIRRSFYRGQRIHRVNATLVQFGDPQTRDMTREGYWGNGGSGRAINAFELVKKYTHRRGMVGLAHGGNPMAADSQLYIMKQPSSSLDGKHAIIGQVTAGMAIVDQLAVRDPISHAYVKGEKPK